MKEDIYDHGKKEIDFGQSIFHEKFQSVDSKKVEKTRKRKQDNPQKIPDGGSKKTKKEKTSERGSKETRKKEKKPSKNGKALRDSKAKNSNGLVSSTIILLNKTVKDDIISKLKNLDKKINSIYNSLEVVKANPVTLHLLCKNKLGLTHWKKKEKKIICNTCRASRCVS